MYIRNKYLKYDNTFVWKHLPFFSCLLTLKTQSRKSDQVLCLAGQVWGSGCLEEYFRCTFRPHIQQSCDHRLSIGICKNRICEGMKGQKVEQDSADNTCGKQNKLILQSMYLASSSCADLLCYSEEGCKNQIRKYLAHKRNKKNISAFASSKLAYF